MSSISEGFDELALPRRKSPAGWTLPPRRRSGVLRFGLGLSPRGSETGSRAGQKSFRPGACFFLHRKPNIFQAAPARRPAMMTACDAHTVTANDSQVAGARGIHKHPAVRSRAREN